jgi:Cdc6-like AAA superfamily ATPase
MEGNQNDWLTQAESPSSPESVSTVVQKPASNDIDNAHVGGGGWLTQAEPPSSPESDSVAALKKKPIKSKRKGRDHVDVGRDDEDEEEADKENENENLLGDGRNTTTTNSVTMLTEGEEEEDGNNFSNSRIRELMPSFRLNGDNVDDCNASLASEDYGGDYYDDSDESSASSEEYITLTLPERRLRNEARNKEFMAQLNHKYKTYDVHRDTVELEEQQLDYDEGESGNNPSGAPQGMLFKTNLNRHGAWDCHNHNNNNSNNQGASPMTTRNPGDELDRLKNDYPCRASQIDLLTSLIGTSIAQGILRSNQESSNGNAPYVPAPIFITGPGGTGKTSVVQDVIESLRTHQRCDTRVASAYINCGILEPSSIERLVSSAFSQLDPSDQQNSIQAQRKKRHKKRGRSTNLPLAAESSAGQEPKTSLLPDPGDVARNDATGSVSATKAHRNRQGGRDTEPIAGAGGLKSAESKFDLEMAPERNSSKSSHKDASWTMHSVVGSFGRALQPICGRESKKCSAILVLDNADRLLSLSMKKLANERTNFLGEILLLPKAMELNLTVIFISTNCCLSSSRKS